MKVLLPTSVPRGLHLDNDQREVQVIAYDPEEPIPAHHRDAEVVVAWMNPRHQVVAMAESLPNLRWVQCLGSGPESFLTAGFGPQVSITRGVDLHNVPVAEHCIALLLAAARRLDLARDAQSTSRWAGELGGNQLETRSGFTRIHGSRFVIWGLGRIGHAIADRVAELAKIGEPATRWPAAGPYTPLPDLRRQARTGTSGALRWTEELDRSMLEDARPVEHVLPGSSERYRTERRQIADWLYRTR